ncbi:putative methyltransferase-domain-containing protein [Phascolomyces articulosus]|uniref:25S rRNA adenine-N(1) methyltransferase n=1 Tax=Phascolomyces articulosus TaxID=60185 RepID=A0AAD5P9S3_9FUNG|nr:putative methyltransferase-domain-containing protein [Phascolomyces articulosus]
MPKARKKSIPITRRIDPPSHTTSTTSSSTQKKFKQSSQETARLIRRFHVLNKEFAKCKATNDVKKQQSILAEMEAMGGIDWYQKASQLGQSKRRGGDSSKWLMQTLKKHKLLEQRTSMVKLLEVGAVAADNYERQKSWIQVKPIDLNPQDPRIQKQDFLEMPSPATKEDRFDIVSLSLVVNFVGDPKDRGRMLLHTRDFLNVDGFLFLVLPLPCINNSRYMSPDHFMNMMESMGYSCIESHFSNKLAYYLFQFIKDNVRCPPFKKQIMNDGATRNNFAIIIENN